MVFFPWHMDKFDEFYFEMMHMLQIYSRIVILLLAFTRVFMQKANPEPHIRLYSGGAIGCE